MKMSIAATFHVAALSLADTNSHAYGLVAVLFLAGCIATDNRWQASQMRAQVMSYYNDEIMENLIKANEHLPFVHVDITGLTNIDTSQISGSISGGDTSSFSKTSPAVVNALHTITRGITSPFSYSVSPVRGNSLQISAAPVLGQLAASAEAPSKTTTTKEVIVTTTPAPIAGPTPATPTPLPDKVKTTTEETDTLTPGPTNIYNLYKDFLDKLKRKDAFHQTDGLIQPTEKYVPGTLKRWGTKYYYIKDTPCTRKMYYDFCVTLFTKVQAPSLGKQLQAVETAIQGTRGLQALPPPSP
jgi:hypothetical protein